jgi:hypothetical protein
LPILRIEVNPLIGPEVESKASGISSRKMAWTHNGKLMEVRRSFAAVAVADELGSARWDVARTELAAAPWWLWWNILSLDAPMVAVAWAMVFAKRAGVEVAGAEIAVLGLVVWLIYTVDRLLDGRTSAGADASTGAFGSPLRQRHFFHRFHARAMAWVAAGVAIFAAGIVFTQIGEQTLKPAVLVGLIVVLYMAWVHLGRGRILARLPKEVAVGGIFAAGVALPAWSRLGARRWEFFVLAALFAAVCALNCVAIEEWERGRGGRERNLSGAVAGRRESAAGFGSGRFAAALVVCAALVAPVVRLRGEFSAIGAAIAVSALLILFLDLMRERISADGLRVLVDVALLAPAVVVLVVR